MAEMHLLTAKLLLLDAFFKSVAHRFSASERSIRPLDRFDASVARRRLITRKLHALNRVYSVEEIADQMHSLVISASS